MPAAHRLAIQIRFSDTDALGHVNNASFAHYLELARVELMRSAGLRFGSLILARLAIDFRRQLYADDPVEVTTEVEVIGRSSVRLRQRVLTGDEVAAEATSVVVHFDYATQRPQAVPDELRERLAAFAGPGAPAARTD
jgi:acyl-CoA thioester hydrolase